MNCCAILKTNFFKFDFETEQSYKINSLAKDFHRQNPSLRKKNVYTDVNMMNILFCLQFIHRKKLIKLMLEVYTQAG